ncbi:MAG: DUF2817 domain-containing protein, partial [Chloroflexota bacterium]
ALLLLFLVAVTALNISAGLRSKLIAFDSLTGLPPGGAVLAREAAGGNGRSPATQTSLPREVSDTPTPVAPHPHTPFVIGFSVLNRPISVVTFPPASPQSRALILINGIHGDETNAAPVLESLMSALEGGALILPPTLALHIIPEMNPDGIAALRRLNANGVDLNRNWQTYDWRTDIAISASERIAGGGGPRPFSEPETRAARDWLLSLRDQYPGGLTVVYFHAAFAPDGLVSPGAHFVNGQELADAPSRLAGEVLAEAAGFDYYNFWPGGYHVTGDASTWAVANGVRALTVELPTHETLTEAETKNLHDAILTVINWLASK